MQITTSIFFGCCRPWMPFCHLLLPCVHLLFWPLHFVACCHRSSLRLPKTDAVLSSAITKCQYRFVACSRQPLYQRLLLFCLLPSLSADAFIACSRQPLWPLCLMPLPFCFLPQPFTAAAQIDCLPLLSTTIWATSNAFTRHHCLLLLTSPQRVVPVQLLQSAPVPAISTTQKGK